MLLKEGQTSLAWNTAQVELNTFVLLGQIEQDL